MLAICSVFIYLRSFWEYATPPHIYLMSGYIITHDQFYQASPCISIASDKCWGGRLGYKAIDGFHSIFSLGNWRALHRHADC